MDSDVNLEAGKATLTGSLPFPEIIGRLMANKVECYCVDFTQLTMSFYSGAGSTSVASLPLENLPAIAADLDVPLLKLVILDSQKNGQKFRQFCERAMKAGVQNYFVFLQGQRVVYMGRKGDQHIEWFPGAQK